MAHSEFPVSFKIERYYDKYYTEVKGMYNLSASFPETLTLREILDMADTETREMWNNMKFSYSNMQGHPLLLNEVSKIHGVEPENILEVIPIEGIHIAMQCLVRYLKSKYNLSKLHAVTIFPAYQSLQENLKLLECDVSNWDIRKTDDSWYYDVNELKSILRDNTKIIVVNFPHNPTGYVPSLEDWNSIVDVCREREMFLFSDEMYRLTNLDGTPPLPSACAMYEDSISLSGLSKSFGLPGLRCGWVCTRNRDVLDMMRRFKDYTSACGSLPSEIIGIITLRNQETVRQKLAKIANNNLKLLDDFFSKYPNLFHWRRPTACTTGFLEIKDWLLNLGSGGATGFCEVLVQKTGLLPLPAAIYDFEPDIYVRIGFGIENLDDALVKFGHFLDNYKH